MKNLVKKLSRVAAAGMLITACATIVAPEAGAEASLDNTFQPSQTLNSGGAIACGGDACVPKIGDTAHVHGHARGESTRRVCHVPVILTRE